MNQETGKQPEAFGKNILLPCLELLPGYAIVTVAARLKRKIELGL